MSILDDALEVASARCANSSRVTKPRGHSNAITRLAVEWEEGDNTRAYIPLEGGATLETVRALPPLCLTVTEWEHIGTRLGWLKEGQGEEEPNAQDKDVAPRQAAG